MTNPIGINFEDNKTALTKDNAAAITVSNEVIVDGGSISAAASGFTLFHRWSGELSTDNITDDIHAVHIAKYWSALNPSNGVYDWTELDHDIAVCTAANKKIMIGVAAGQRSPLWLVAEGVPYLTFKEFNHVSIFGKFTETNHPVPFNATYKTLWKAFVTALITHLKVDNDVWTAIEGFCLNGVNKSGNELRLPNQALITDPNTGNQSTDAPAVWKLAGYTTPLIVSVIEEFQDHLETEVDDVDKRYQFPLNGGFPRDTVNSGKVVRLFIDGRPDKNLYIANHTSTTVKSSVKLATDMKYWRDAGSQISGQTSNIVFNDGVYDAQAFDDTIDNVLDKLEYAYLELQEGVVAKYKSHLKQYVGMFPPIT